MNMIQHKWTYQGIFQGFGARNRRNFPASGQMKI